jgi:hypothetical protein
LFCRGAALNSTIWCYTLNICIRFLSLLAQTDVLIRKFGLAWSLDIVRLSRENVVSELLFTEGHDLHRDVSLRSFTDVWILTCFAGARR